MRRINVDRLGEVIFVNVPKALQWLVRWLWGRRHGL